MAALESPMPDARRWVCDAPHPALLSEGSETEERCVAAEFQLRQNVGRWGAELPHSAYSESDAAHDAVNRTT